MNIKRFLSALIFIQFIAAAGAQNPMTPGPGGNGKNAKMVQSKRTYVLFSNNERDSIMADSLNSRFISANSLYTNRGMISEIGAAILQSYGSAMVSKTASATTSILNAGVDYISSLVNKERDARESWLKAVKSQCAFKNSFPSESKIEDFYFLTSQSGAMDPLNLKFRGFGCYCYMRPEDLPEEKRNKLDTSSNNVMEFLVSCRLRTDSLGIAHIVNHSKFYVELDRVVFDSRHVALANDSIQRDTLKPFDFDRRKNLVLNLNVKVYSSWINEAAMIFSNQQIGEFNITARISKDRIDEKGVFVYDPAKDGKNVFVTGESFIVPRSYSGTYDNPRWGTGQYRLEMTVSESCEIDEKYYMAEAQMQPEGKKQKAGGKKNSQWNKEKWMPEWVEMQNNAQRHQTSKMMWNEIKTSYVGTNWVQEVLTPFTTAVNDEEKIQLNGIFGLTGTTTAVSTPAATTATDDLPVDGPMP